MRGGVSAKGCWYIFVLTEKFLTAGNEVKFIICF